MELVKRDVPCAEFSPEFKREFVEKILIRNKTLNDLADELGIPPGVMRKWTMRVGRDEVADWKADEPQPSAIRILELEHDLEELKHEVEHQAITIQILENNYSKTA